MQPHTPSAPCQQAHRRNESFGKPVQATAPLTHCLGGEHPALQPRGLHAEEQISGSSQAGGLHAEKNKSQDLALKEAKARQGRCLLRSGLHGANLCSDPCSQHRACSMRCKGECSASPAAAPHSVSWGWSWRLGWGSARASRSAAGLQQAQRAQHGTWRQHSKLSG